MRGLVDVMFSKLKWYAENKMLEKMHPIKIFFLLKKDNISFLNKNSSDNEVNKTTLKKERINGKTSYLSSVLSGIIILLCSNIELILTIGFSITLNKNAIKQIIKK